ncbi:Rv3235 family protein [Rhodococcus sp. NPDC127528]|uniref:Rv3235 family protein n=1 Tax=unclassified Rhodococcus (in: high G+C Gram-positive bacteria) TaxID=192944 RepID=UPI00363DA949
MTGPLPFRGGLFVTGAPPAEPPLDTPGTPRTTEPPLPRHSGPSGLHAPRRSAHDGRSPSRGAPVHPADPAALRFAETALRLTLEVLDRRRQPAQLRTLLEPAPIDLVAALARAGSPARRLGVAQLQRVHLRPSGPDVAEMFGTYARGNRTFAVAGRVERRPAAPNGTRDGWLITSLQLG